MRHAADMWQGRRARWLTAGAVGVLIAAGAIVRTVTVDADTAPPAPVTVAANSGAVTKDVAATGTVEPAQNRTLSFTVAGTVTSVSVRPGTVVRAGQRLAAIDDDDAREGVEDAEDKLDDARDTLSAAKAAAAAPASDGTGCATGTQTAVRQAAYVPLATPTSAAAPSPTPASPSNARPSASVRSGRQTSSPAPTASCPAGNPSGGRNQGSDGGDAILSAEQRVHQAAEDLAEAEAELAGTTITAPIAGTVLDVSGAVGSRVSSGATFVTLADTFEMQAKAKFPEADAGSLAVGQTATVTLADRAELEATVVQVDPVGTSDGTLVRYGVVLAFTESPDHLLIGQSAAVRVRTGAIEDAVRVPATAVHDIADGRGTVLLADGAARREVSVGLRGDQYTEITSGLTVGEVVHRSW